MKRTIALIALGGCLAAAAQTGDLDGILQEIDRNNLELQALRKRMEADVATIRSANNLDDPTVSYTHKYDRDNPTEQESELAVTQGFDFPTAYATRHKLNRMQEKTLEAEYALRRRDILLQAKIYGLDLIGLDKEADLLNHLLVHADSIILLCRQRLDAGDATILELNRAKLDRMTLATELADNTARHRETMQRLLAMNGNRPLPELAGGYPLLPDLPPYEVVCDRVLPVKCELQQARLQTEAARGELALSRSGWLPRLEVGYRRNTSPAKAFNGFVVGGSIPLFSNKSKVKSARSRLTGAELGQQAVELQAEAGLQALYNEISQVKEAMGAYDLELMDAMLPLMDKALYGGELPLAQFFETMNNLIRRKQAYIALENRYQKLMAELYADDLSGGAGN